MKLRFKLPAASMKIDEEGKDHQNLQVASTDGQKNKPDGEGKDHENFEAPIDKKDQRNATQIPGVSKSLIFSSHFSPYQSHMDRELSEELLDMKKKKKRSVALANWDWDSVVDLGSSQDEESESELSDTADSAKPAKKLPRITIHRRNRVLKLIDESSEDE